MVGWGWLRLVGVGWDDFGHDTENLSYPSKNWTSIPTNPLPFAQQETMKSICFGIGINNHQFHGKKTHVLDNSIHIGDYQDTQGFPTPQKSRFKIVYALIMFVIGILVRIHSFLR